MVFSDRLLSLSKPYEFFLNKKLPRKRGGTNHSNAMVLVVLIITKLLEEKKLEIIFHLIVDLL